MGGYLIYPVVYTYVVSMYALIRGRIGFALFLFILFLFAALRGDVGNDACGYQSIYQHFNLENNDLHFGRIEPVFALLNTALNFLGFGHQSIFIAVAGGQSLIYFKIHKYIDGNTRWLLAFIVLMYYYSFYFNTIRYGLAVIVFSLAFILYLNGDHKRALLISVLSIGIHVATAPLLLLMRKSGVKYMIFAVITVSLYDYFIDSGLVIAKLKYIYYLLEYSYSFNASLDWFVLRKIVLLIVILWLVGDLYYKVLFSFFILIIGTADAFMPVIGRFSEAYVFILLIYLSYVGVRKDRFLFLLPFVLLSIYSHIVYPIIKGDAIMKINRIAQGESIKASGVKYSFFFEDEYLVCEN